METQDRMDISAADAKGKATKTRKRASAKASTEAPGKRSLNLRIDDDSYKRLSVHALMRNSTISDLVMEFARSLKEYSMPHRIGARMEHEE
jgi:hypothetical protein